MALPPILGIKHLIDWKKEAFNDFICEISHDEDNAKRLLDYSEKELLYAIHWIQLKINRITMRVSSFFGEKQQYSRYWVSAIRQYRHQLALIN